MHSIFFDYQKSLANARNVLEISNAFNFVQMASFSFKVYMRNFRSKFSKFAATFDEKEQQYSVLSLSCG